jgi:2'-5' RNA ligase
VSDLRVLPPSSLHATVAFLGERGEEEVEEIGEAITACAAPVRDLRLGKPAALGRGHALAVDLVDGRGDAAALQRSVGEALSALGVYEPEQRRYRPHVTVARGDRVRVKNLPPLPRTGAFGGRALTLFRSHLGRGGARYEALVSASLHVPEH